MVDYVYALVADDMPGCKIGYSKNPKSRAKSISHEIKKRCEIKALISCRGTWGAGWIEKEVHRILGDYRIKNEWFDTTPKIARSVAKQCVKVAKVKRARVLFERELTDRFYAAEREVLGHSPKYVSTYVPPKVIEQWKEISGGRDIENLLSAIFIRIAEDPMLLQFLDLPSPDKTQEMISCQFRVPALWAAMEAARAEIIKNGVEYRPASHLK